MGGVSRRAGLALLCASLLMAPGCQTVMDGVRAVGSMIGVTSPSLADVLEDMPPADRADLAGRMAVRWTEYTVTSPDAEPEEVAAHLTDALQGELEAMGVWEASPVADIWQATAGALWPQFAAWFTLLFGGLNLLGGKRSARRSLEQWGQAVAALVPAPGDLAPRLADAFDHARAAVGAIHTEDVVANQQARAVSQAKSAGVKVAKG